MFQLSFERGCTLPPGYVPVVSIYPGHPNTLEESNDQQGNTSSIVVKNLKDVKTIPSNHSQSNKQKNNSDNSWQKVETFRIIRVYYIYVCVKWAVVYREAYISHNICSCINFHGE